MNVSLSVRRALGPVGPDAGCEGAALQFPRYADRAVAGDDVARTFPEVANHLAACPDCHQDYEALVACIRALDTPPDEDSAPG